MKLNKFCVILFLITAGAIFSTVADSDQNSDKQLLDQINNSAELFLGTGGVIFSTAEDEQSPDKQPLEPTGKKAGPLLVTGNVTIVDAGDDLDLGKQSLEQINKKADRLFGISDKTDSRNIKLTDKGADKIIRIEIKTDPAVTAKKAIMQIESSLQGDNRDRIKAYLDSIPADEKKRLMELYQQDAEKCREEINSKVYELKKQENSYQKTMAEIVDKYNATQIYEEKQKYRHMLREASKKEFYRNLERSKIELGNLEKRLNSLRQTYETRKNNADKIIDDQVEYLTRDPSLHW